MKGSDYLAQFLAKHTSTVFCLTGGCIVHTIDSVARSGLRYIPVQHEQAGAMAADAHARISGELGVMLTTSGPGATNLLTGVCCSYYDSIPVLLITGQVPKNQLKGESRSRQIGFQETDVLSIFKPVTKMAIQVYDAEYLPFALHKAVRIAREGRPGPVLLDICDDVQRADLSADFTSSTYSYLEPPRPKPDLSCLPDLLNAAKRPLLILGGGIRRSDIPLAIGFAERHGIPFTLTWAAMDFCPHDHPLFAGGFGVTSGRAGNFAVQNADLLLAIGTRLDTHETGNDYRQFAPNAKKVIVDIDPSEQEKYSKLGMEATLITADSHDVLTDDWMVCAQFMTLRQQCERNQWQERVYRWRAKYPAVTAEHRAQKDYVNPYVFIEELSKQADDDCVVVTDCGSNLIWTMQAWKVRGTQRIISAWNHSPMGYSLPAAIGAALSGKQTICIIGDGGFQINVQELATIAKLNLPIKIFVMNNRGHGIIQGTQDAWLEGRHYASAEDLPKLDIELIALAYGIYGTDCRVEDIGRALSYPLKGLRGSPSLWNVPLRPGSQIEPKLMYGRPIHDSHPLLPREELERQML
jgi:acetolactate synthase-1/2/3 large subunit